MAKAGTSPLTDAVDYAERSAHSRLRLHEYARLRSGFAHWPRGRRLQPDRLHHRTRQRHRLPFRPGAKIASNSYTYRRMQDNMDINAGAIADGEDNSGGGPRNLRHVLRVASGGKTCAERLGHHEFVPWRIGPVM